MNKHISAPVNCYCFPGQMILKSNSLLILVNAAALFFCSISHSAGVGAAGDAGGASKASRYVVVGVGECSEPALIQAIKTTHQQLVGKFGELALDPNKEASLQAPVSLDEVKRLIEAGKNAVWDARPARAEQLLLSVLPKIDRIPSESERWKAFCNARVYLSWAYLISGRGNRAAAYMQEILTADEDFKLDAVEFPPSVRGKFEAVRSRISGGPHFMLAIRGASAGSRVFLNGNAIGQLPIEKRIAAGNYEFSLRDSTSGQSASWRILVDGDYTINWDLEKDISNRLKGACFNSLAQIQAQNTNTRKLESDLMALVGRRLGANQLVVVRQADFEDLTLSLLDVAQKRMTREERVKGRKSDEIGTAMAALWSPRSDSGDSGELAGKADQSPKKAESGSNPGLNLTPKPSPNENASKIDERAVPDQQAVAANGANSASGGNLQRVAFWSLTGAAVVLGAVAVVEHFRANSSASDANEMNSRGIKQEEKSRYDDLRSNSDSARKLATGLAIGAGASAASAGLVYLVYLRPGSANSAAPGAAAARKAGQSANGASVSFSVSGSF